MKREKGQKNEWKIFDKIFIKYKQILCQSDLPISMHGDDRCLLIKKSSRQILFHEDWQPRPHDKHSMAFLSRDFFIKKMLFIVTAMYDAIH